MQLHAVAREDCEFAALVRSPACPAGFHGRFMVKSRRSLSRGSGVRGPNRIELSANRITTQGLLAPAPAGPEARRLDLSAGGVPLGSEGVAERAERCARWQPMC
jgi:hypothetical protein